MQSRKKRALFKTTVLFGGERERGGKHRRRTTMANSGTQTYSAPSGSGTPRRSIGKRIAKEFRENAWLYLMCLPGVLTLLVFCYLPMFGLVLAFQKMDYTKGILGSPFVGLSNFKFLFTSTDAWIITRNTVCYNIVFIIVNMSLSIGFALVLSELRSKTFAKTMQTIIMMPHFLSWAVVAIIVFAFLAPTNGYIPSLIFQLTGQRVNFYMRPSFWPGFLVFLNAWKGIGYSSVVYLASITGISR